ncbi:hypothetical protein CPB83DRAFT_800905 [Crepidotus variabilis]|uniref:DUF6533 domain-containing protein n=1 Tax=Crepidotus variabilis TaxID=179855 RepID=A0A9P6E4B6_9AGAR|nr:hypothetical protein CPB83DRAFT_800905 [Crepidotus variabilis]
MSTTRLQYNVQYASLALIYYDYSLTWTREVKYFWRRKFSLSTLLYCLCRYSLVANVLYTLAISKKLTAISCNAGYQICSTLSVFGRVGILVVWGARTYAVFDRHKIILAVFTTLGLLVIILSAMHVPFVTCIPKKGTTRDLGMTHERFVFRNLNQCDLRHPIPTFGRDDHILRSSCCRTHNFATTSPKSVTNNRFNSHNHAARIALYQRCIRALYWNDCSSQYPVN